MPDSGLTRRRGESDNSDNSGDDNGRPPRRRQRRMDETERLSRQQRAEEQRAQLLDEQEWRARDAQKMKPIIDKMEYRHQIIKSLQEMSDNIINNIKGHHQNLPQDVENRIRRNIRSFIENRREEHRITIMKEIELALPRLEAHRFRVEYMETRVDHIMHLGLSAHHRRRFPPQIGVQPPSESSSSEEE